MHCRPWRVAGLSELLRGCGCRQEGVPQATAKLACSQAAQVLLPKPAHLVRCQELQQAAEMQAQGPVSQAAQPSNPSERKQLIFFLRWLMSNLLAGWLS